MATLPFTAAFVSRLRDPTHAYRFTCEIGNVDHFLYFCCGSPYQFSVTKAPVAVLSITPDTQCTGVNLVFNIDASYVPLGTLDSYNIDWGDSTSTGVQAWGGGPGNINHNYAAAGTYTVTATVTDTLGTSGSVQAEVLIVDCANDAVLIEQMYALSQTAGPYVRDMTAAAPAWVQRAAGLTGTALQGVDLKLDPHTKDLPFGQRDVWIVTNDGPAKSTTDCLFWSRLAARLPTPRNDAGDAPAPVVTDLSWFTVAFNPRNVNEVYILTGIAAPNNRAWVYWTTDGGTTFGNWQVNR